MFDFENEMITLSKEHGLNVRTLRDLTVADKDMVQSYYDSLSNLHAYSREIILPYSNDIESPDNLKKSLINIFQKVFYLVESILKLNELKYYQSNVASVRTIFELYMDMQLLMNDCYKESVMMYTKYPMIKRFISAQKMLRYYSNKDDSVELRQQVEKFLVDCKNDVEKDLAKYWGFKRNGRLKSPLNWSDENTIERARRLDSVNGNSTFEDLYMNMYMQFSWHIHADPLTTFAPSKIDVEYAYNMSFKYSFDLYIETILLFGRCTNIDTTYHDFENEIQNIRNAPLYFLLKSMVHR